MSIDHNLERSLSRLLADEAPVRGPDSLAESVLARTGHQRPRPRWLVLMTRAPMRLEPEVTFGSPAIRSLGVVGIGALILVLALTAIAVGASLLPRPSTLVPPDRGVFSVTGQMAWPNREDSTATLLADGRVLVIGGAPTGPGTWPVLAELWDPATSQFTPAGALRSGRTQHTATLLTDGRVLILGGYDEQQPDGGFSAEIWDPESLSFPEDPNMYDWGMPSGSIDRPLTYTATALPDGRVEIVAYDADGYAIAGHIWDPARDYSQVPALDPLSPLPTARFFAHGTVLKDGRVLIAGGNDADGRAAKIWNPQTESFAPSGSMSEVRSSHTQTLLSDGRVLIAGGYGEATKDGHNSSAPKLASAEIWNPDTGRFSPTGSMEAANAMAAAVSLGDGRVLIVGGTGPDQPGADDSAEVFTLR